MHELAIQFSNPRKRENTIELRWRILDHPPALYWMKPLIGILRGNGRLFPRFTGFINGPKDMAYISQVINACIETINRDGRHHIPERAEGKFTQKFSNAIHHHFEILRGRFEKPTDFYHQSPPEVIAAIYGLNHCTHDMETLARNLDNNAKYPGLYHAAVIVESIGLRSYRFPDEIYDHFTLNLEFGDMYLHYSQIGKTWLEVFIDQDEDIFDPAIIPHYLLSGEFDIFFGESALSEKKIREFHDFLRARGKDPADKKLALGFCPVARLIRDPKISKVEYKRRIGEHSRIERISLFQGGQEIAGRRVENQDGYGYLSLAGLA